MNDDKAAEEIKNLLADFKILASKKKKKFQRCVNKNIKNCFMNTML